MLQKLIDEINDRISQLQKLKIDLHDEDDKDWGIDKIYYSEAHDKVIVKFKEVYNEKYFDASKAV